MIQQEQNLPSVLGRRGAVVLVQAGVVGSCFELLLAHKGKNSYSLVLSREAKRERIVPTSTAAQRSRTNKTQQGKGKPRAQQGSC